MEVKNTFAQNLAKFRKEKKISQIQMAKLLEEKLKTPISNSSISHWEKGDYIPSVDVIFAYCDILEISANDIYGTTEKDDSVKQITPAEHLQLSLESVGISKYDFDKLNNEEIDIILANAKSLAESFIGRK